MMAANHRYSVDTLRQLAAAGSNFYKDLLRDFERTGGLTAGQLKYVQERDVTPVAAPPATQVVRVSEIEKAFAASRAAGIKHPKLHLDKFRFTPAPATGKNPGAIYAENDRGLYLGKVLGGTFWPQTNVDNHTVSEIIAAVNDPHAAAVAFGKRFGRCSVCTKTLTNKLSIELGIGPVCRSRMGWGK